MPNVTAQVHKADPLELGGRDLDAAIAERVMGYRWYHCVAATGVHRNQFLNSEGSRTWRDVGWDMAEMPSPPPADQFNDDSDMPHYSTSIEAAMEVVEKMGSLGWSFACTLYEGKLPYASFCTGTVKSSRNAEADSLPEAICRAALRALEHK